MTGRVVVVGGRPEFAEGLRLMVGALSGLVESLGGARRPGAARALLLCLNVQAGALQDEAVRLLMLLDRGEDEDGIASGVLG